MKNNLSEYIDHTCLKQNATNQDIVILCNEAKKYSFKSVCVLPCMLPLAYELLEDEKILPISVVGFPTGMESTEEKLLEAKSLIEIGAKELDMVINIKELKNKNYQYIFDEIQGIVKIASPNIVKVIIETCFLTNEEKIIASAITKAANAKFVKTSTGFGTNGATIEDVTLIKDTIGNMDIKASGNIKTYSDAINMIIAGASRIGTSSSVKIMKEKPVDFP